MLVIAKDQCKCLITLSLVIGIMISSVMGYCPDIELILNCDITHYSASEQFDATYPTNVVVTDEGECTYIPPGGTLAISRLILEGILQR